LGIVCSWIEKDILCSFALAICPEAWVPFAEGKNDIFNNEVLISIGKKIQQISCASHYPLVGGAGYRRPGKIDQTGTHG